MPQNMLHYGLMCWWLAIGVSNGRRNSFRDSSFSQVNCKPVPNTLPYTNKMHNLRYLQGLQTVIGESDILLQLGVVLLKLRVILLGLLMKLPQAAHLPGSVALRYRTHVFILQTGLLEVHNNQALIHSR